MDDLLVLDGSYGEGGGQILRTAILLSVLLQKPFRIERIRANRRKSGLKPQHAGILLLLERMGAGSASTTRIGAEELEFAPSPPRPGAYAHDVGTAGSLPLLLQTVLPVAAMTGGRVELQLTGGTDVPGGPSWDWYQEVFLHWFRPLVDAQVRVERRGFAPGGGGSVRLVVERALLRAGDLVHAMDRVGEALGASPDDEARTLVRLEGRSIAERRLAERTVAERQADSVRAELTDVKSPVEITPSYTNAASPGSVVALWSEDGSGRRMGADALGAPRVTAEAVGAACAKAWLQDRDAGATVDRHMADHVVPWIALGARSERVPHETLHLTTNVWLCQKFLGDSTVLLDGAWLRRGPVRLA